MPIYDISLTLSPTLPIWPGDPAFQLTRESDLAHGDEATVSRLNCSAHIGTHVDAPAHFLLGGRGVETLDLDLLIGPAWVADVPATVTALTAAALEALKIPSGVTRLLFRTRNSEYWTTPTPAFQEEFVAVTADGAAWLVERGILLVGVDYLSVAPFHDGIEPHQILLSAGVIPLEGLNLSAIEPGAYQLICLPLKLQGCDGAPARAVLLR
jgi:arylformamidase